MSETFHTVYFDWPYASASPVRGKDDGAAGRLYGPISFLTRALQQVHRVALPGAHLYVFANAQGIPDTGFAMSIAGWCPTTIIAWDGCYVGTGGLWRGSWTPIFFASKGPAAVRVPGAFKNSFRVPAVRRNRRHPYEKPPGVWKRLGAPSVVRGCRVLDVFAGSGSSRRDTERRGGIWYGIDVDPRFADPEG
jgi:DNA modification methylase